MLNDKNIQFSGKILDNVHGFIFYTKTEERIMDTLLFKRLQSIKQLSIVNWVFPGSEHTRYIHSLGVMYIADKIAIRLNLSIEKRKIVRLAGLLHDIGHYPMSHVCELPYKENLEDFPGENYCKEINTKMKRKVDDLSNVFKLDYMRKSTGMHHEQMGADIVINNTEIRNIIVEECGENAPEIIADMITGNAERTDPLLVQILHSEIDADGIDYLMRDAMFSGTSFGVFELDQLIDCMCIGKCDEHEILCISPKGIAAADQYLINKFFSYSQVVFNKHVVITEWMMEQIVDWMQKNAVYFPKGADLKKWVTTKETDLHYLNFTDNFFWTALQSIIDNPLGKMVPCFIQKFCDLLLHHSELMYVSQSELKLISADLCEVKKQLQENQFYKQLNNENNMLGIFNKKGLTKQISQTEFEKIIKDRMNDVGNEGEAITEEDAKMLALQRYMECICVKEEDDSIHLLCDDRRSLMQKLYNVNLVVFRAFYFDR